MAGIVPDRDCQTARAEFAFFIVDGIAFLARFTDCSVQFVRRSDRRIGIAVKNGRPDILLQLLRRGVNIVSSNRRSFAIPYVEYSSMHAAARESGVKLSSPSSCRAIAA